MDERQTSPHPATRVPRRGLLIESLLLAALALLVLNFHPFGSAHLRRHFSQDLVYAWFGGAHWLYPRPPDAAAPGLLKPTRAVVVLVDEAALALRGARWPVPLPFHAQMLAEVAVLRPRAVMLDFLLIDRAPPDDVCSLLVAAGQLREADIPVYLAVTAIDDLSQLDAPDCVNDAGRRVYADRVLTPVSVKRQVDDADFVSRLYPFEQRGAGTGQGLISAAVRMYCDTTAARDSCASSLARRYAPDAGFELAWSPEGDPFNKRWSQTPCGLTGSPVRAILRRTMMPREMVCVPIATVFASALLSDAEDPGLDSGNEGLSDVVQGSIVLIGGNFRASGDLISTPMHTLLPGVYYHAVALENLLMFDGRPKVRGEFRRFRVGVLAYDMLVLWALAVIFLWHHRLSGEPHHHGGPWAPSTSARAWFAGWIARTPAALSLCLFVAASLLLATYPLLQLAALLAAVPVLAGIEIRVTTPWELRARLRSIALYLGALGLSLGVVTAAVWFGYRWLSLPPGDWIGYLSFSTVGFFVAHTAIVDLARHVGSIRARQTSEGGIT
jgi:CHASE2 domain-containing sensor protein